MTWVGIGSRGISPSLAEVGPAALVLCTLRKAVECWARVKAIGNDVCLEQRKFQNSHCFSAPEMVLCLPLCSFGIMGSLSWQRSFLAQPSSNQGTWLKRRRPLLQASAALATSPPPNKVGRAPLAQSPFSNRKEHWKVQSACRKWAVQQGEGGPLGPARRLAN